MNIIFDMDGVIFDTERCYHECAAMAGDKVGLEGVDEVAFECIGVTEEETARKMRARYGDDAPLEEFAREMRRIFMDRYEENGLPMKEGVVELLEFLKQRGAKIAVASSTKRDVVEMELRDAGLIEYFDVIVGGDMAQASKPAPDVFLLAAEKLGVDIQDCIVIEDSFNGVRAARTAGATVFMVPDMLEPTDEIRALTDRVFDSLMEVKEWIETRK